ncbi:3-hydroxyacyl-CoA dehydrogenase family protein [Xanthobacter wiegelii]|uniref:3-hydroxyacyl-CoA dehydrogenase family protein n=1 Tax=Xanthobacter wiegelii TaxID=3119913 RepID=UPI003728A9BA
MTLAMIGSGLMGGGIALDAARHGLDVLIYDARPDGLPRLKERAAGVYARWAKNGRMTSEAADAALTRLLPAPTLAEVGKADIVIEAVFEDLSVKRAVFAELAPHLGADTVVATNTSALRVAALAEGFDFADRVLGLHYFSPAEVCPLVEVVRAARTGDAAITGAMNFLTATRRTALACADTPGFAINRFFCPYYNEATRIAADGLATPEQIDLVARERLGVAAGPFTVLNLIGPRVAGHAMANLGPLGPFYAVTPALIAKGKAGGLYDVAEGASLPATADAVEDRLLAAIAIPALELLAERVADPQETDRGAVMALKFKQGPYALMGGYPLARLEAAVASLCARDGHKAPLIALPAAA